MCLHIQWITLGQRSKHTYTHTEKEEEGGDEWLKLDIFEGEGHVWVRKKRGQCTIIHSLWFYLENNSKKKRKFLVSPKNGSTRCVRWWWWWWWWSKSSENGGRKLKWTVHHHYPLKTTTEKMKKLTFFSSRL